MGVFDIFEMVDQIPLQVNMTVFWLLMIQYIINNTCVVPKTIFKTFVLLLCGERMRHWTCGGRDGPQLWRWYLRYVHSKRG